MNILGLGLIFNQGIGVSAWENALHQDGENLNKLLIHAP